MPVFDMPETSGDNGSVLVFATMLAPDDPRGRDECIELARTEVSVAGMRKMFAEGDLAPVRLEETFLKYAEIFQRHIRRNPGVGFGHGLMAGAVLGFVLGCAAIPELRRHASVSSASRALSNTRLRGTGVENFRQNVWPTYRPVSHFWAAYGGFGFHGWDHGFEEPTLLAKRSIMEPGDLSDIEVLESRWKACQERFEEFLALSQILLRRGESWVPHRGRAPVLDGEEMWRLPDKHPALALIPDIEKKLTVVPPTGLI